MCRLQPQSIPVEFTLPAHAAHPLPLLQSRGCGSQQPAPIPRSSPRTLLAAADNWHRRDSSVLCCENLPLDAPRSPNRWNRAERAPEKDRYEHRDHEQQKQLTHCAPPPLQRTPVPCCHSRASTPHAALPPDLPSAEQFSDAAKRRNSAAAATAPMTFIRCCCPRPRAYRSASSSLTAGRSRPARQASLQRRR